MSLNRFTPAESRAVHLLKQGDVFVEYGDPTYKKWTVVSDAQIAKDRNGFETVSVRVEETNVICRYLHSQRTRVKLWHDSQFQSYNYG